MGDDQDKTGYPGPPCWGLGVRLKTPPRKKYFYVTSKKQRRPRSTQGCRVDDDDDDDDLIKGTIFGKK